jgi:hypothetical protein
LVEKIITYFETEDLFCKAVEELHRAGITKLEYFTPYYIKNLPKTSKEKTLGISILALTGSFIGLIIALLFIYWSGAVDYKLNIGGKPFFSLIFSLPIAFEISLLIASLFGIAGFLIYSKLPQWYNEYYDNEIFRSAVDDKFVIIVEINDNDRINFNYISEIINKVHHGSIIQKLKLL